MVLPAGAAVQLADGHHAHALVAVAEAQVVLAAGLVEEVVVPAGLAVGDAGLLINLGEREGQS